MIRCVPCDRVVLALPHLDAHDRVCDGRMGETRFDMPAFQIVTAIAPEFPPTDAQRAEVAEVMATVDTSTAPIEILKADVPLGSGRPGAWRACGCGDERLVPDQWCDRCDACIDCCAGKAPEHWTETSTGFMAEAVAGMDEPVTPPVPEAP